MEKQQLIKFIGKVMEDSGFKVYKNFRTANKIIDIYAILPSDTGNSGVIVACKNYDKEFEVGIDVLEDMVETKEAINASKITIVTSSSFSPEAIQYAEVNNIKLVDRQGLTELVKKYQNKQTTETVEPTLEEKTPITETETNPTINVDTPPITDSYDEEVVNNFINDIDYENSRTNQRSSLFGGNTSNRSTILNKQTSNIRSSLSNSNNRNFKTNTPSNTSIQSPEIFKQIKPYLSNTIVLIAIVTIISYVITALLIFSVGISRSTAGIVELLLALALSYGIILFADRDGGQILIKGTIAFFVSLILLMILTIAL